MRNAFLVATLSFLLAPAYAQTAAKGVPSCDRACLRGMLTNFLDALIKHDPKSLPLAANVRFTEDTHELPLGEGLWKTAQSLGAFRQDIIDVRQGIAGTHTIVQENGMPTLTQVRLKVAGGKINEIDTTVVRNRTEGMIFSPQTLKAASPAMNVTPEKSQLNSREEMSRLALLYPAGLKVGSFVKVDAQFATDAYRLENGQLMAGPGCTFIAGCDKIKEQKLPTLAGIQAKVAAVDEEQGIVWLRMSFGPGSLMGQEGTLMVWEMFKVYGGKIQAVEAIMETAPLNTAFGWDY
ncbi:MAG: hypothetical protein ABI824_19990 [Acidobacteriota bacterium]